MHQTDIHCNGLFDLPEVARRILKNCGSKKIAFYGSLGAGKTTLIKEICKQLEVKQLVSSPTFTILNEYEGLDKIYHFDFYRIKKTNEVFDLGFEEYFFSDNYVFIEWPEIIEDFLPEFFCRIIISDAGKEKRIIRFL